MRWPWVQNGRLDQHKTRSESSDISQSVRSAMGRRHLATVQWTNADNRPQDAPSSRTIAVSNDNCRTCEAVFSSRRERALVLKHNLVFSARMEYAPADNVGRECADDFQRILDCRVLVVSPTPPPGLPRAMVLHNEGTQDLRQPWMQCSVVTRRSDLSRRY